MYLTTYIIMFPKDIAIRETAIYRICSTQLQMPLNIIPFIDNIFRIFLYKNILFVLLKYDSKNKTVIL